MYDIQNVSSLKSPSINPGFTSKYLNNEGIKFMLLSSLFFCLMNTSIAEELITKDSDDWKQEYQSKSPLSDDCFFAQRSPIVQGYFNATEQMSADEKYLYSAVLAQNCAEEIAREQFLIARKKYLLQIGTIGAVTIGLTSVVVVGSSYVLNQNSEQNNFIQQGLAAGTIVSTSLSGRYVETRIPLKRPITKREAFQRAKEVCKKFQWNCLPQNNPNDEEFFFMNREQRHRDRIQELLIASQQLNSLSEETYQHWQEWTDINVEHFVNAQKRTENNPWMIRKNIKKLQQNLEQLQEDIPKVVVLQNIAQNYKLSPSAHKEFSRFTNIERIPILLEALQKEIDALENTKFPDSILSMERMDEGWREQQFIFKTDQYSSVPKSCTFKLKMEDRETFLQPIYSPPIIIELPYRSSSLPQAVYEIPFELPITSLQDIKNCIEKHAQASLEQLGSTRAKNLAVQIDFFFPETELKAFIQKKNIEQIAIQKIDPNELPSGLSQELEKKIKSELRIKAPAGVNIVDDFEADDIAPNLLLVKTSFSQSNMMLSMEIFGETAREAKLSLHIEEFPIEVPSFKTPAPKETQIQHPDGSLSTIPSSCYKLSPKDIPNNPICAPLLKPLQNQSDTPEDLKSNDNQNTRYLSYAGVTKGSFNLKFTLQNKDTEPKQIFLPMGTIVMPKDIQKAVGIVALDVSFSMAPNETVVLTVPMYCKTSNLSLPNTHQYQLSSMQLSSNLLQGLKNQPANQRQEWLWRQEDGGQ